MQAAKLCQLPTDGWLSKHCLCQDGDKPELKDLYGMREHLNVGYPPRTKQNVFDSCATIRYAVDFKSAGEKLTLSAIRKFNKPHFDIHSLSDVPAAIEWIKKGNFKVLNCAGNSENTASGIFNMALHIFTSIFVHFGVCPACNGSGKIYGERLSGPTHLPEQCDICG